MKSHKELALILSDCIGAKTQEGSINSGKATQLSLPAACVVGSSCGKKKHHQLAFASFASLSGNLAEDFGALATSAITSAAC